MDGADFLKKGFLGTGMIVTAGSLAAAALHHNNDEIQKPEIIGFNHLPNTN